MPPETETFSQEANKQKKDSATNVINARATGRFLTLHLVFHKLYPGRWGEAIDPFAFSSY
jgi:hypothetical protein